VCLHVSREAGETRLDGDGGTPPYRILHSESNTFADPTVLEDAWSDSFYVDFGTFSDGRDDFYRVD
jgi:hypothetical protein